MIDEEQQTRESESKSSKLSVSFSTENEQSRAGSVKTSNTEEASHLSESIMQRAREEAYNEAREIVPLLAARAYHLPGNNCCQDWCQFMRNNHPLLGIFCHHRLHPLRLGQRIICLIGSVAFGLAATNCVFLYYAYYSADQNEILFRIHLESSSTSFSEDSQRTWEVTHGMLALWTFGGLLHSVFDLSIWYISACSCCLPGGTFTKCAVFRNTGSYIVVVLVALLVALATFVVVLRASYESRKKLVEEGYDLESVEWGEVKNAESFTFILGYFVELPLALFFYYPLLVTILFSGVLGCGVLPFLGGRPREVTAELRRKQSKRREYSDDDLDSLDGP